MTASSTLWLGIAITPQPNHENEPSRGPSRLQRQQKAANVKLTRLKYYLRARPFDVSTQEGRAEASPNTPDNIKLRYSQVVSRGYFLCADPVKPELLRGREVRLVDDN